MAIQTQYAWLKALGIDGDQQGAYDGTWFQCSGEWLETRSPATGEVIGRVKMASKADYDRVVKAAHEAFAAGAPSPAPPRRDRVRWATPSARRRPNSAT
ncbi:MAG: aldehyde dehydrogenase family protein [Planctomycetota bacterium]